MSTGALAQPYQTSLAAFWPGMQAMVGDVGRAVDSLRAYTQARAPRLGGVGVRE